MFSLINKAIKQNKNYFEDLKPVEKLFILVLSSSNHKDFNKIRGLYYQVGENDTRKFAESEKCESFFYSTLIKAIGKSKVPEHWLKSKEKMERKIKLYMAELDKIGEILSSHNIELLALKNTGIARGIYPKLAESPMGDIDVLISPNHFKNAHDIMLSEGYKLDDRSPFKVEDFDSAYKHGGTEYTCYLNDGTKLWIELQWRSVSGRRISLDQEPSFNDLIRKSIPINNSKVRLLSPEDNLVQVCLHTAKHSFVRAPGFRLHTDVERIVRSYDIDWDLFLEKVSKMRIKTPVYISLFIPFKLFELNIPDFVLSKLNYFPLKSHLIMMWLKKVGIFGPDKKKWSKLGYIIFNILLFDEIEDLFKSIFPDKSYIKKYYGNISKIKIMKIYFSRILSLIFQRGKNI